jgi:trimeric autotransporter adhesin
MTQTQNYYKTVFKNLATKSLVFWLSSAITLSSLGATVAVNIYKCPIGSYLNQNYDLEVFQECVITEGFTVKELKGRLANLGKNISTQGVIYQNEKLVFSDGKVLDLNNIELKNSNINDLTISDDKIVIAKTGGNEITLQKLNQAIKDTNINSNGQSQTLSISSDTLAISNGNFVKLPGSTQSSATNIQNNINQVFTISNSSTSSMSNQNLEVLQTNSTNQTVTIISGGNTILTSSNSSQITNSSSQINSISSVVPVAFGNFNITTNSSGLPINLNPNETLKIDTSTNLKSTIDNANKKITLAVIDTPTFTGLTVTNNANFNGNITLGQLNDSTPVSNSNNFLGFDNSGNLVKVTPAVGAQGIKGDIGLQGAIGLQGVTGFAGQNGTNGIDGLAGIQGIAGPQGLQGIQGVVGLTGAVGPRGIQGLTGINGLTGLQGVIGATGAQGIQGIAGVANIQSASNGITLIGSYLQLGGTLSTATTINTDSINTLSLTGLQSGASTDRLLVQDENGVLKTTTFTLSPITIQNGTSLVSQGAGIDSIAEKSIFLGEGAGSNAMYASNSTFIGSNSGGLATNASHSIFIGGNAGWLDTVNNPGYNDTSILIGDFTNTGGFSRSIAIGYGARNNASNQFKIAPSYTGLSLGGVDYQVPLTQGTAGQVLTNDGTGLLSWNTSTSGGSSCTPSGSGISNLCLGIGTLGLNTTGFQNTSIGKDAQFNNTVGFWNVALGDSALYSNQTGNSNIAIGSEALRQYTLNNATAVGNQALTANTTGYGNTALGANTLNNTTIGGFNTGVGAAALQSNITGEFNTALGIRAGYNISSGNNNVSIGADSDVTDATGSNQLSIGNWIYGSNGLIGIGTNSPSARLEIASGTTDISGLKFTNFNSSSPTSTGQTLGVDASGNIVTISSGGASTGIAYYLESTTAPSIAPVNTGNQTVAIGSGTIVKGTRNFAIGNNNILTTSSADNSIFGHGNNNTAGSGTTIIGNNNIQNSFFSTITGNNNTQNGSGAIVGSNNNISAYGTYILGENITSTVNGTVQFGTSNTNKLTIGQNGSVTFQGALQPNGFAGATGQVLVSQGSELAPIWSNPTSTCNNNYSGNGSGYGDPLCIGGNDAGPANPLIIGAKQGALSYGLFLRTPNAIRLSLFDGFTVSDQQFQINPSRDYSGNYLAPNNDSGLTLSQLSNTTPTSSATNYLGFDNAGKVVKVATPSSGSSSTASNGLTLTGSNITLGGLLTQNTVINGSSTNNYGLSLTNANLAIDNTNLGGATGVIKVNGIPFISTYYDGVFVGKNSGNSNAQGISNGNNTGIGNSALNAIAGGGFNTAIGSNAMRNNTDGYNNTAVGGYALGSNIGGYTNNAFGSNALGKNQYGRFNNAMGASALYSNLNGSDNVALGTFSLFNSLSGANIGIGSATLYNTDNGGGNIAIGTGSVINNGGTLFKNTTGSDNVAIGNNSFGLSTTGNYNVGLGRQAGNNLVTGSFNIAIGTNTSLAVTNGSNQLNIANNIFGTNLTGTVGSPEGLIGIGTANPTARLEIASGTSGLSGLKFTNFNSGSSTSIGQALGVDASGNVVTVASSGICSTCFVNGGNSFGELTSIGTNDTQPLIFKTGGVQAGYLTASINGSTGFGYRTLLNSTAGGNTAIGIETLTSNTTGLNNTAIGTAAMTSNISGRENVALGHASLYYNTTGASNTGSGQGSIYSNTTGNNNVASGYHSLFNNTTGVQNTAIGSFAGMDLNITNGSDGNNTFLGYNTGRGIFTGKNNTILGAQIAALSPTLSNNIILADGSGNRRINVDGTGNVGINTITQTNKLTVDDLTTTNVAKFNGSGSTQCTVVTGTGLTCSSDERLKAGIITGGGLDQINQLRGVQYYWKNGGNIQNGFIAQEVASVIPNAISTDSNGYLSLNQNAILPVAVNAIKELDTKVKVLENKISTTSQNSISSVISTPLPNTANTNPSIFTSVITFVSDTIVKGTAWIQDLVVKGSTVFQGRVEFQDKDMAGVATLKANTKEIEVRYVKPYDFTPVVNVTALGHRIIGNLKSSNANGFVIEVENPTLADLKFNWVAINARGEELISTTSITIVSSSSIATSSSSAPVVSSSASSQVQSSSTVTVSSSSVESISSSSSQSSI